MSDFLRNLVLRGAGLSPVIASRPHFDAPPYLNHFEIDEEEGRNHAATHTEAKYTSEMRTEIRANEPIISPSEDTANSGKGARYQKDDSAAIQRLNGANRELQGSRFSSAVRTSSENAEPAPLVGKHTEGSEDFMEIQRDYGHPDSTLTLTPQATPIKSTDTPTSVVLEPIISRSSIEKTVISPLPKNGSETPIIPEQIDLPNLHARQNVQVGSVTQNQRHVFERLDSQAMRPVTTMQMTPQPPPSIPRSDHGSEARTIHVHIGTIEVRALMQEQPKPRLSPPYRSTSSLEDYLKKRNEGRL